MFFPVAEWFPAFVLILAVELLVATRLPRRAEPDLLRRGALVVFAPC